MLSVYCGQAVDNRVDTVRNLCYWLFTEYGQFHGLGLVVHQSDVLYSALYAFYTRNYALPGLRSNRLYVGLIPRIHRLNNKDYGVYLKVYNRKTVEGIIGVI